MTSRAGQLFASPTWGGGAEGRGEGEARRPAARAVRLAPGGSAAADAAAMAGVLGATVALWLAFLGAVW